MGKASRIQMRLGPCRCGCKGTDPQHAKTLVRVVRNVREVEEPAGANYTVVARGTVQVPWGEVEVVRYRVEAGGRSCVLSFWMRADLRS